ncbi:cell division protein FtsQ/DivIB [Actinophytocola glycyrrhizae]|uniref:Cell division protein FtsQ/DivIB n=1 Tax=Actinophytocola glycyrrhizae TaxID=2044873 RepID=A0ABV9S6L1_9PSEU
MPGTARGGDRARRGTSRNTRGRRSDGEGTGGSGSRGRRGAEDRAETDATERAGTARTRGAEGTARTGATRTARTRAGAAAARRARGRAEPGARATRDSSRTLTRRRPRTTRRTEAGGPTRSRYLARRWMAVLVVLSVVAVAYLVMFTSLLGVRSVEVVGTREIAKDDVLEAAAIEHGTPMVRLDADEAAARVAKLSRVFEVVVERSWPSTVEIIVTERVPVAVRKVGAELHLIDVTGLDYAIVKTPPPGLPTLAMDDVRPGNPATRAAVTVLRSLPKQLRTHVVAVSAATPGDVRLTLADGRVVRWGSDRDNERKAAVLAPLLTRPGKTYDVATPDFPTVAG